MAKKATKKKAPVNNTFVTIGGVNENSLSKVTQKINKIQKAIIKASEIIKGKGVDASIKKANREVLAIRKHQLRALIKELKQIKKGK